MKQQLLIDSHPWRKTPLTLAILAALQGTAVQEVLAAGAGPTDPLPNLVGPEFRVNTYTTGGQGSPAVAMDAAGDFVVAWTSYRGGRSAEDIYAQRYNAAGQSQGSEFRVNTYTTDRQNGPVVAMDAAGDFVVIWQSYGQAGGNIDVYAQRYNAAGQPQGSEFRVNNNPGFQHWQPAVAMDAAGDFVVTWVGDDQSPSQYDLYARRYNAAGVSQESEFRVNPFSAAQTWWGSAVAMDAAGDFVVTWQSFNQGGSGNDIYARRYNAAGVAQGAEFRINTYTTGGQVGSAVAMDAAGDFVVAWLSDRQDGSNYGVYARRYNAAGVAQDAEFQVNTYTTSNQSSPAMSMDAVGNFVITWQSYGQEGTPATTVGDGVYAQRYNAAGVAQGAEFRVNTYTTNYQSYPAMAMDAAGDFVVAWQSSGQDGSGGGIYAQRYAVNNYNAVFSTPVLSNQRTDRTPVPTEGPWGTFSFDATFCNNSSAYPLSGLVSQTVTLTNNNCLVNRNYGPAGMPPANPVSLPCGAGSALDFPVTGGYNDSTLAVGECVTVHYQIGLQNRNRFSVLVDVGGI